MDPSYLGRPIPTPSSNRPRGLMTHRTFVIVAILVVAVIAGMLLMFASSDSSGTLQQRLSARQATTLRLIADGQKNLNDDRLSKLNSELSIVLAGDTAALEPALKAAGMKKVEKTITTDESDAETFKQLESARLNAQYDTTYRRILTQKIESLRSLVKELHDTTKTKELKPILASEYEHLGIYLNELTKLD